MGRYINESDIYNLFPQSGVERLHVAQIDELTRADVVEVKHGCWIEDGYADVPCVCSNCGAEAQYVSSFDETFDYDWEENLQPTGYEKTREYIKTPYCSNCGAKMDGERAEE